MQDSGINMNDTREAYRILLNMVCCVPEKDHAILPVPTHLCHRLACQCHSIHDVCHRSTAKTTRCATAKDGGHSISAHHTGKSTARSTQLSCRDKVPPQSAEKSIWYFELSQQ